MTSYEARSQIKASELSFSQRQSRKPSAGFTPDSVELLGAIGRPGEPIHVRKPQSEIVNFMHKVVCTLRLYKQSDLHIKYIIILCILISIEED